MVFDTLDKLELYLPLVPKLQKVIEVMDRGDVYDMAEGTYGTGDEDVSYAISLTETTAEQQNYRLSRGGVKVLIILEGDELVSSTWREAAKDGERYDEASDSEVVYGDPLSVLRASPGRFMLFLPGEPFKCGVALPEKGRTKKVVFTIT